MTTVAQLGSIFPGNPTSRPRRSRPHFHFSLSRTNWLSYRAQKAENPQRFEALTIAAPNLLSAPSDIEAPAMFRCLLGVFGA